MKDLALPPPGTHEPEGKPSKARLGDKPVLPPPVKALDESNVKAAVAKASAGPAVIEPKPVVLEAPPPDLRVEREPLPTPRPEPMKREKSRSSVSKVAKAKKKRRPDPGMMDDEIAVVAVDPRRGRSE